MRFKWFTNEVKKWAIIAKFEPEFSVENQSTCYVHSRARVFVIEMDRTKAGTKWTEFIVLSQPKEIDDDDNDDVNTTSKRISI